MHSMNEKGEICVDLNDFEELSDSIRLRHKIDQLMEKYQFPKELSNFSITFMLRTGRKYYLSNLYYWAIPYRTEGYDRGDIDHAFNVYDGQEYYIQEQIKPDSTQMDILEVMQQRYNLHTVFAMVRQCYECDIIIETYNNTPLESKSGLYFKHKAAMERFISGFIQDMEVDLKTMIPESEFLNFFNNQEFRSQVLTGKLNPTNAILTNRELDCLFLMAHCENTQTAADKLCLSVDTVNSHLKSARKKLNCKTTIQAVTIAFKSDLFRHKISPNLGIQ